ncbi:stage V sporulation protein AB [Bacillus sp. HNG]|uniref:stage V sporulation protein AB n=1 Tax=Bacillaceae TaxID=186817 RepID=UPI000E2F534A|nr:MULTISPECIES: stage V sporulation protein AB [Bacillaceae]MDR4888791.1 stage V sporulation protein AB [Fredinandcohnia sp. QZ13]RFB17044.1 stage V sporulation protein AB [Bacillus sp. HNG]
MTIKVLLIMFIGLGSGLAVGGGFVAFLAVLGIIPRLTQLTKTMKFIRYYEWGVVLGAVFGGWFTLNDHIFNLWEVLVLPVGLASGIFVGMLAAALTEVLNVFPILAKRIGIDNKIIILVMAIVFGKIAGSLFQWMYYVK